MVILLNKDVLKNHGYLPDALIGREEQISTLEKELLLSPLGKIYISGDIGVGKTAVVKLVLSKTTKKYIFISCKYQNSYGRILSKIAEELGIASVGKDVSRLFNDILDVICDLNCDLILILDEISEALESDKNDDAMFNLLELDNFLGMLYAKKAKEKKISVRVVFITNKSLNVRAETWSRITTKLSFPRYNVMDLTAIAKFYAEKALAPDTYDELTLVRIAKNVYETTCSVRDLKELLCAIAEEAEKKKATKLTCNETQLEAFIGQIQTVEKLTKFSKLPDHQKYIMFAIAKCWNVYDRYPEDNKKPAIPDTGKVYTRYSNICLKYGEEPKSMQSFWNFTNNLEVLGLITKTVQSFGKAKGVTTVFQNNIEVSEEEKSDGAV